MGPNSQPVGTEALDDTSGAPLAEQQQQTIHEQVDTRPLAKLQEQKKAGHDDDSSEVEKVKEAEAVLRDDDSHLDLIRSVCYFRLTASFLSKFIRNGIARMTKVKIPT